VKNTAEHRKNTVVSMTAESGDDDFMLLFELRNDMMWRMLWFWLLEYFYGETIEL